MKKFDIEFYNDNGKLQTLEYKATVNVTKPKEPDVLLSFVTPGEESDHLELMVDIPEGVKVMSFHLKPLEKKMQLYRVVSDEDITLEETENNLFSIVSVKEAFEIVIRRVQERYSVFATEMFSKCAINLMIVRQVEEPTQTD